MPPYGVRFCRDGGRPSVALKAPSGRELAPKAPEGEREIVESLQSEESYTVVAPKVWRAVSKTKTDSLVARSPPAA